MQTDAYVVDIAADGTLTQGFQSITLPALGPNEVRLKTVASSVNYKDFLATQAQTGVVRHYPIVPGIDVVGEVIATTTADFTIGELVVVTGYGLGTQHDGGFATYVQVPAAWVVKLPRELTPQTAMQFGTAGVTAAAAILKLQAQGMTVADQPRIVVSGATGGVGSLAIAFLQASGYQNITALVRHHRLDDTLKQLGATTIRLVDDVLAQPAKPLLSQQYDYALDTVGAELSAYLLAMLQANGAMAMTGNVAGNQLPTTVLPFILRGITVIGIDSVNLTPTFREQIWQRLASDWQVDLGHLLTQIPFEELPTVLDAFANQQHHGRTVITF